MLVREVLAKCDVLKQASFWPPEPAIRPHRWLNNFDESDRGIAALLLDKFTYYNERLTDSLFIAAYQSIGDGIPKGPRAPSSQELIKALSVAVFTPVTGETPNPTDSGYTFCRKARQLLGVPEELVVEPDVAIKHAQNGDTIVFVDDFIGSGDQFVKTWNRHYGRSSPTTFNEIHAKNKFVAIYIALVTTDYGLGNIHGWCPDVAVCTAHTLSERAMVQKLGETASQQQTIDNFLNKYAKRLRPKEPYIAANPAYLAYGYKTRGLLFGFQHSIPDATLPIFWAPGDDDWRPLVERL